MIRITKATCGCEREPLRAPFGFKGGQLSELWQTVVAVESERGHRGLGLGTQSTLWSDAGLFGALSETAGNEAMLDLTREALRRARNIPFETPLELLDALQNPLREYGKNLTARQNLRLTFILNALVALDNAAWFLFAMEKGCATFDAAIPKEFGPALACRQHALAAIPLISYGVTRDDILELVTQGASLLKIKVGSDPADDGDLDKMLAWDRQRLTDIHALLADRRTPHTESGRILYYLDANGRYDSKERVLRLLDHAAAIDALEHILLLEEPFPEECRLDVSDLPVRIVADESAHSEADAIERMDLGYGALALKPIAKTLSQSLRIAQRAHERGVPCFCADLTVNPILVDWNKNVAARLAPLPGMRVGVLESNGHQNYRHWDRMLSYHPCAGASWIEPRDGLFHLDEDFYAASGGIFEPSQHYWAQLSDQLIR